MKKKFLAVGLLLSVASMHASGINPGNDNNNPSDTSWFDKGCEYAQRGGKNCINFLKDVKKTITPETSTKAGVIAAIQVARKAGSLPLFGSLLSYSAFLATYAGGLGLIYKEYKRNPFLGKIDKDTKLNLLPVDTFVDSFAMASAISGLGRASKIFTQENIEAFDDNVISPVVSTTILNRVPLLTAAALACSQSRNSLISIGGTAIFGTAALFASRYNDGNLRGVEVGGKYDPAVIGVEVGGKYDPAEIKDSFINQYISEAIKNSSFYAKMAAKAAKTTNKSERQDNVARGAAKQWIGFASKNRKGTEKNQSITPTEING